MLRRLAVALAVLSALLLAGPPRASADDGEVDLALVLAVDVSLSMDMEELRVQREGYMTALADPEVLRAIRGGMHGRIAVTYVEWAGWGSQMVLVPWTIVDGPAAARAVVARLAAAPTNRLRRTSISGAMTRSLELFDALPNRARRRVIDISGDGPNNEGPLVTVARQAVLERGITINGLPVMITRQQSGWFDIENLDQYYEDCVIGGPGAFVVPVTEMGAFAEAIRTKLVMEISDLAPARVLPASAESPRVPCDIGERRWGGGWDRR